MSTSWRIINTVIAIALVIWLSSHVTARLSTRDIASPMDCDSGISQPESEIFIGYLRRSPYVWHKNRDGTIVGILDRGFWRYYQVEWHPASRTLVVIAGYGGCKHTYFDGNPAAYKLQQVFSNLAG